MKIKILLIAATIVVASCERERPLHQNPPSGFDMSYIDLTGKEIPFRKSVSLDLNNDNRYDISFTTELVGDAIGQRDKMLFLVASDFFTSLPVNEFEESPVKNKNEVIPIQHFDSYTWYNASAVILAQKIIPLTGDEYWEGNWKDISHRYLPIQVKTDNKRYNGWVELSFDRSAEKTILHRAAISKKAEIDVRAGV